MSGKKICAVFCFAFLLIGMCWERNVYEQVWSENPGAVKEVFNENTEQKVAYLTFDDGPSILTKEVLDILEKEKIRATFFLIGCQITEEEEELLQEMAAKGHLLGVHTYSHKSSEIYSSVEAYVKDANQTADRIWLPQPISFTSPRIPDSLS